MRGFSMDERSLEDFDGVLTLIESGDGIDIQIDAQTSSSGERSIKSAKIFRDPNGSDHSGSNTPRSTLLHPWSWRSPPLEQLRRDPPRNYENRFEPQSV